MVRQITDDREVNGVVGELWAYSLKPIDAGHSAMPCMARPVDGVLHHFHRELKYFPRGNHNRVREKHNRVRKKHNAARAQQAIIVAGRPDPALPCRTSHA